MTTIATRGKSAPTKALLLGLATVGLATAVHADTDSVPTNGVTQVVVKYGDLNLASADGTRTLYARLRAAARQACGDVISGRNLQSYLSYEACYSDALDGAVSKVGSARLQALHREQTDDSTVG
jgi:UrcA family protein